MEKGTVFTFTPYEGVEVKAVALKVDYDMREDYSGDRVIESCLCYGQNRLFLIKKYFRHTWNAVEDDNEPDNYRLTETEVETNSPDYEVICDYVIIPELDEKLKGI